MVDKLLTEDDYKKILQRRFNEPDITFMKSEIKPLSENIEGFMGEHYKMKITYQLNGKVANEHFFIKTTPTKTDFQREVADRINVYDKEIFLYDVLLKEFEKYGYDTSFAPKCYYCIPGKTMVMEDAARRNFVLSKRNKLYDLSRCETLLRALALFHGAGFAFEQKKSKELGRPLFLEPEYQKITAEAMFTTYIERENKSDFAMKWIESSNNVFIDLVDLLPEEETFKETLKERLRGMEIGKIFAQERKNRKTFGHGDLWSNNMLFRFEEDIALECCLLDFQLFRYFYPTYDVIIAIFSNTNKEFRKKHLEYLYQFYYDTLKEILKDYGFDIADIYPENDYREALEIVRLEAQLQAFATHSFVFLPVQLLNDGVNSGGDSLQNLMFGDRTEISRNAFHNDPVFRDLLTDDLYELNETLKRK